MKKIRILSLITLILLNISQVFAQDPEGSYNPYVNEGTISPSPLYPVEVGGTGIISFNVGNSGSDPLDIYTDQYLTLTITLSYGEPDNIDPIAAVSGTAASLFDWSYNSGTYTAVQNAQMVAGYSGTIIIDYQVTVNSSTPGSNGFNVNITPAAYQTGSNTLDDDAVSSYTYTEISDFGDAPSTYGDASHTIDFSNYLGSQVDGELASIYSANADGDDLDNNDDEDGVVMPATLQRESVVDIPVTVTGLGYLNAWIDWNGDGDFLDDGEQVASNVQRLSGTANLSVTVPADAVISTGTFARFRFSNSTLSSPVGAVEVGEVEDYALTIVCAPPVAAMLISENDFCSGSNISFTASGGTDYQFFVDGVVAQGGTNSVYQTDSLSDGQSVEVVVTDAIGCSATSDPLVVNVLPLPLPVLSSSDTDNMFCSGSEVVFTASGGETYDFRIDGASVQAGTENSYTTSSLLNGQVVDVIVADANNCKDTSGLVINTVNSLPVPVLTISDSDSTFCDGTEVIYSASGGTNYNFRIDGVSVQDSDVASYTSSAISDGQTIDVIITDNNLCSDTSAVIVNNVIELPLASIGSTPDAICQGESSSSLDGAISGSATGGVWSTSAGGTFVPSATTLNASWTPPADYFGTATLVLTTTGGDCGNSTSTVDLLVNENPELVINNPEAVCSPSTVDLTAAAITAGSTSGMTYTYWTDEACTVAVSTPAAVGEGTYYIRGVLGTTGCSTVAPVQVVVTSKPATPVIDVVDNCDGSSVLSTTATGTLLWSTAESGSSILTTTAGTYTLTQTVDGCVSDEASAIADPHTAPGAPEVISSVAENTCPDITVDLTGMVTSTTPINGSIYYKTTDDSQGLDVSDPAHVGAGTYYLFYEDENGCFSEGTDITVSINECPPDVTPTLLVSPNIMHGETSFDLVVRITELNDVPTSGSIEIHIPKDSRWYLSDGFVQGLSDLNGTSVNNSDWIYTEDAINHIFTTDISIPGGSYSSFGFSVTFDPGSTRGWYTITAQLVSGGGGEVRVSNNVDSERIDYFQE